jgi:hypothetical protein
MSAVLGGMKVLTEAHQGTKTVGQDFVRVRDPRPCTCLYCLLLQAAKSRLDRDFIDTHAPAKLPLAMADS